ncbi:MAG: hypothetical protein OXN25_21105 [Candidatus Poribacteria bacterium]|nr:hypothetical protein [Candidatus Poribacteria bacterium]
MNFREWVSTRTVAITGIIAVLLFTSFHFYTQQEIRNFEVKSLNVSPTAQQVETVIASNTEAVSTKQGEVVVEKSLQTVNTEKNKQTAPKATTENAGCGSCGCQ